MLESLFILIQSKTGIRLPDGAGLYYETDVQAFVKEPWNAFSSLAIVAPVVFWLWYLRGKYKRYPFIIACMPFLFIGGTGSTFFHAFRASPYLLMMDWMPIIVLVVLVSVFVWQKVLNRWWLTIAIVFLLTCARFSVYSFSEEMNLRPQDAINLSYFIGGTTMFLPILLLMFKTRFQHFGLLVASIALFGLALFFRYYDRLPNQFFPMGTHWLWHISTGVGVMPLAFYLKHISEHKTNKEKP